jgi:iron(III) transport system permease protein
MNFNLGAVVGIMLLLPTVLAFYLERVSAQRQFGSISDAAIPLRPVYTRARDIPMAIGAWLIALMPLLTVGIVIYASFVYLWPYRFDLTLRHYDVKVAGGYDPLWTTVQVSLIAASFGTLLLFALGLTVAYACLIDSIWVAVNVKLHGLPVPPEVTCRGWGHRHLVQRCPMRVNHPVPD